MQNDSECICIWHMQSALAACIFQLQNQRGFLISQAKNNTRFLTYCQQLQGQQRERERMRGGGGVERGKGSLGVAHRNSGGAATCHGCMKAQGDSKTLSSWARQLKSDLSFEWAHACLSVCVCVCECVIVIGHLDDKPSQVNNLMCKVCAAQQANREWDNKPWPKFLRDNH